jgi:hypothetical protein
MAKRVITAEVFYDLFMLCLAWQSDEKLPQHSWTTVDKVVRILSGMEILTSAQKKNLYLDAKLQRIFLKSACLHEGGSGTFIPSEHFEDDIRLNITIPSSKIHTALSRERMLRDYRIYITARGQKYGLLGAKSYEDIITFEAYFAEIERQIVHAEEVRGILSIRYRAQLDSEVPDS